MRNILRPVENANREDEKPGAILTRASAAAAGTRILRLPCRRDGDAKFALRTAARPETGEAVGHLLLPDGAFEPVDLLEEGHEQAPCEITQTDEESDPFPNRTEQCGEHDPGDDAENGQPDGKNHERLADLQFASCFHAVKIIPFPKKSSEIAGGTGFLSAGLEKV